jgi:DNA-binding MarR family transcriptional regulator
METMTKPTSAAMPKGEAINDFMPPDSIPESPEPIRLMDQVLRTLISKGISTKMLHAVTTLYLEGKAERSMSMGELSLRIGISSAAFTRVADGIERIGLVCRSANANDRRSTKLRLTQNGLHFVEWVSSCLNPADSPHPGIAE